MDFSQLMPAVLMGAHTQDAAVYIHVPSVKMFVREVCLPSRCFAREVWGL